MKPADNGFIVLDSGRVFYASANMLSIGVFGPDVIGSGYDGLFLTETGGSGAGVYDDDDQQTEFTPAERHEVAMHMARRWLEWGGLG